MSPKGIAKGALKGAFAVAATIIAAPIIVPVILSVGAASIIAGVADRIVPEKYVDKTLSATFVGAASIGAVSLVALPVLVFAAPALLPAAAIAAAGGLVTGVGTGGACLLRSGSFSILP